MRKFKYRAHTHTILIPSISVKNVNKLLLLWNGLEILVWKYLVHSWIQINILLDVWPLSFSFLETNNWILLLYFQGSFFGYVLPVLVFSAFYNIPKFFEFSTSYNPGWVCRKYEFYFASFQGFRIRIGSHFHWLVTALFCICCCSLSAPTLKVTDFRKNVDYSYYVLGSNFIFMGRYKTSDWK